MAVRSSFRIITIILLILLLGFAGIVWMLGSALSAPQQTALMPLPTSLPAKRVTFNSSNGNQLVGWLAMGDRQHGGILLMHGVRSNKLQMLNRATFLQQAGYTVLLFDFQAHGESQGKHITFGYRESKDAESAFNYLQKAVNQRAIGVIGVSLGGASALLGKVSQKADALIFESVYPTLVEAVENRVAMRLGSWGKYLAPILLLQVKPRLGFTPEKLNPIEPIASVKGAIFIITGANDLHTTVSESQRMYDSASEPKQLWIIPKAIHQNFDIFTPELYKKNILDFFNKSIPISH